MNMSCNCVRIAHCAVCMSAQKRSATAVQFQGSHLVVLSSLVLSLYACKYDNLVHSCLQIQAAALAPNVLHMDVARLHDGR